MVVNVLAGLEDALERIPHGTPLRPVGSVPYTAADKQGMRQFLYGFAGQGVVSLKTPAEQAQREM